MDKLAMRVLKEQVAPKVEWLLGDRGVSEMELRHIKELICISKDLLECDVMLKKLGVKEHPDTTYPGAGVSL